MKVGPYTIHRRNGVIPPPGLAFVPTLMPQLSDDEETYVGRAKCDDDMSPCNVALILEAVADARLIVEIGVAKEDAKGSVSRLIMDTMPSGCVYIGIDRADKRRYHDPFRGIHIITADSAKHHLVWDLMAEIGRDEIDVLIIDGWHSVNQCLADWHYTSRLSPSGVCFIHDIHHHPGPAALFAAIDERQWRKFDGCPGDDDYGLGVVGRRHE